MCCVKIIVSQDCTQVAFDMLQLCLDQQWQIWKNLCLAMGWKLLTMKVEATVCSFQLPNSWSSMTFVPQFSIPERSTVQHLRSDGQLAIS